MDRGKKRKSLAIHSILPNKRSKLTKSSKNHTYETFTKRIARLKIDPIRRPHARALDDEDITATASYFRTALENWIELNLSEHFTRFVRDVDPLCDSLPQIIHHADKIFELLISYLEKGNAVSLEPLLDLIAQFAHDLGVRFEKYFSSTVKTVNQLASQTQESEAIEWSFNCLAWLFKYLSRLLIPDLRPLYDAMAPLLGKQKQKLFVSRFAAEALSFLIRRAAVSYHKNKEYLQTIIKHILIDIGKDQDPRLLEQYQLGVISLLSESIKGVNETLNSNGEIVFGEILEQCENIYVRRRQDEDEQVLSLVQGLIATLLHTTNAKTFHPIIKRITTPSHHFEKLSKHYSIKLRMSLVIQISSFREGKSIEDWRPIVNLMLGTIPLVQTGRQFNVCGPEILAALAICQQSCTIDVAIGTVKVLDDISKGPWEGDFLRFCEYHAELGIVKFKNFVLQSFQRFIREISHCDELIMMIPKFASRGLSINMDSLPLAFIEALKKDVLKVDTSNEIHRSSAILEMLKVLPPSEIWDAKALMRFWKRLTKDGQQEHESARKKLLLASGQVLGIVADVHRAWDSNTAAIFAMLCSKAAVLEDREIFWESLLKFVSRNVESMELAVEVQKQIIESIQRAVESPNHIIRSSALKVLATLYQHKSGSVPEILEAAISVEDTQPSLETVRFIEMRVRKIGQLYNAVASDPWISHVIPSYCFGLLRVHFASIWDAVYLAVKDIISSKEGEAAICEVVFRWLNQSVPIDDSMTETLGSHQLQSMDSLEQNTERIDRIFKDTATTTGKLEAQFLRTHAQSPTSTRLDRNQALQVLKCVPQLAEKKSRALVPVLLNWAAPNGTANDEDEDSDFPAERWNRKDQKAMLSLFASFTNPKSLYRAEEVQAAILSLLCHGDIEIQRSALQAIFSRKDKTINQYRDEIEKFLDEAKLREQLTTFLDIGESEEALRDSDRSEVMPIILRILYGRVINRSKGDQQVTRKAVFGLISKLGQDEANWFLNFAMGPFQGVHLVKDGLVETKALEADLMPERKRFGLLNMLKDMLDFLGSTTSSYAGRLVDPVFYCLIQATRQEKELANAMENDDEPNGRGLARSIRSLGLNCLNQLFLICPDFDWSPYVPLLYTEVINLRLEKLHIETTQGISALLRIFGTWAESADYCDFLIIENSELLQKLASCVGFTASKEVVRKFILGHIFLPLLARLKQFGNLDAMKAAITSIAPYLLTQLELALNADPSKELLQDCVTLIADIAQIIQTASPELLKTCCSLLRQPTRKVSTDCKITLLYVLNRSVGGGHINSDLFDDIFNVVCSSLARGVSTNGRVLLTEIAMKLAEVDDSLSEVAALTQDLNSYSVKKLDQPDFARREKAFQDINEKYMSFSSKQWSLLLASCLFYIKDADELAIRASASHSIRRFVQATATKSGEELDSNLQTLQQSILAGIETGIKDQPELVRSEYLAVLSEIIKSLPDWQPTRDLKHVIWNDEEASFFVNILHIQQHRRLRALRRLQEEVGNDTISSKNIAHILVPLLEHFVFEPEDGVLAAEASNTIGFLVQGMDFNQFRSLFRRYIGYIQSKSEKQETVLKLLDHTATSFSYAAKEKVEGTAKSALSRSIPKSENLMQIINEEFLPKFTYFLREKDESFVSRRVAAVVIAARITQALPAEEFRVRFPPLLTDTCNILRSMDQNSRDMTRKALSTICSMVGPVAVGFVVGELRRSLQRGFYLHVLGYSVHSLLESTLELYAPGDLDYCVNDIVGVVLDDVFGSSGQEKDATEYITDKTTKREVKSKKSFDTMQIIASVTTLPRLIDLVRPIKLLLLERLSNKMMRNVDELLRRLELGIVQNKSIKDKDILVFCYQLIQDAYGAKDDETEGDATTGAGPAPLPVKSQQKRVMLSSRQERMTKIIRFGLELIRSIFKKHKDLKTPASVAGFLPIIGDALLQDQEEIKLAAIRLFTSIVAVPLPQIAQDAPVYVEEAVKIVDSSSTANDELSQAALKLVAAVLRERKNVTVSEQTIVSLLKKVKPELQVLSQQGVAFNLLRAAISRKIIVPEIYALIDGLDGVASISVRDHDRTTRDLARGVYLQFVMEYPQTKKRFDGQMKFLVRNLEYEYAEGRQSVMESINMLISRIGPDLVQEIVKQTFWPVVSVMTNDDSSDCRSMAHALLKSIIGRANEDWLRGFLTTIRQLLGPGSKSVAKQTALQCWSKYLAVKTIEAEEVNFVSSTLEAILSDEVGEAEESWQLRYYALNTFLEICKILPEVGLSKQSSQIWQLVYQQVSFPHAWVKFEAAKLAGQLMSQASSPEDSTGLVSQHGLQISNEDACTLTQKHLNILRVGVTQDLASQVIRNLAFFGKHFAESEITWPKAASEQKAQGESDGASSADESDVETEDLPNQQSALQYLFRRLAGILRRESRRKKDTDDEALSRRAVSLIPRSSAFQLIAALCTSLPTDQMQPSLHSILLPLIQLTDASNSIPTSSDPAFEEAYTALASNATELMDMLQTKLGTTEFVTVLQQVKGEIEKRRDERRTKRRIERVTRPEIVEKRKVKVRERDKARRQEKSAVAKGKRRGW
ncbi:hypothetical protein BT63DRAFT_208675 [Microthyrium microscopicum]|uniref:Uncharacterized protein n=1 Tax=Microthyrium microscopicum TaxID=703497 RepID=A0A6A6UI19_9PEZI|nr:hypothetical protein BT63DRAFT_208675 [Microthyrium microscopicum]